MARITCTAPAPKPATPTCMRRAGVEVPDVWAVLLGMSGLLGRLRPDAACLSEERLNLRRDRAVLRRRATETRGLVALGDDGDALCLRQIAEDVHRLCTELHLAHIVSQHL